MKTYAIYVFGIHLDTICAYTEAGAIAHFLDDNDYHPSTVTAMEIYIP